MESNYIFILTLLFLFSLFTMTGWSCLSTFDASIYVHDLPYENVNVRVVMAGKNLQVDSEFNSVCDSEENPRSRPYVL